MKNRMRKNALVISLSALFIASTGVVSAQATDFTVTIEKLSMLNPSGDTASATISGLAEDQGIYVRLCAIPAGALTNSSMRPTQCDGQGKWVSNLLASQLIGAGKANETVKLDIKSSFIVKEETIDCLKVACAIHTRRDHFGGASDFSLDRYYHVSFGPASGSASLNKGKLTVVIKGAAGKVVTLAVGKKIYNRNVSSQNYSFAVSTKETRVQVSAKIDGKKFFSETIKTR